MAVVAEAPIRREPLIPSGVLGMSIFVLSELMFFSGLISAHTIAKASAGMMGWPPIGQPRLPVEQTAVNTVVLLLSGVLLYFANRAFRGGAPRARLLLAASILAGAFFVAFQGVEWVALLGEGLTMTSSTHGSYFYLIVGVHALHAVVAIGLLCWTLVSLLRGTLPAPRFWAVQVFWYFVVGVWPILYQQVYL